MTQNWVVSNNATPVEKNAFQSLDKTFALEGELIAKDLLSQVLKVSVGDFRYYVKLYVRPARNPLRYWVGASRIETEWRNLMLFSSWEIPTVNLIAHGMERRCGRFVRGAMVTAELPGTTDLARLAKTSAHTLANYNTALPIIEQVASIARKLHDNDFAHNDLHWRNLLYKPSTQSVFLIDCPNGRVWPRLFLRYRKIKDLASLDKFAKLYLSRTQRLRFLLLYLGQPRLTPGAKRWAREIQSAHKRRAIRKRLSL